MRAGDSRFQISLYAEAVRKVESFEQFIAVIDLSGT